MIATELMIGDLVIYGGLYTKVIYIGQKISLYDGKGTEFTIDPCHIEPIPLTEDVLAKNGFDRSQRWHYCTMRTSDDFRICVQFKCGGGVDYITIMKHFNDLINRDVDVALSILYVHQLQHLLRLCGIEKEIEL